MKCASDGLEASNPLQGDLSRTRGTGGNTDAGCYERLNK